MSAIRSRQGRGLPVKAGFELVQACSGHVRRMAAIGARLNQGTGDQPWR